MKKLICIFLTICLLTAFCLTANAASPLLTDEADLLTSAEEAALEQKLAEISARQGMDIVIVAVESTGNGNTRDFADDWFDYNDYRPDGILLLVSLAYSDWYVSTTGYGITAVTDAGLDYMSDQFVPYMSDGDFATAFDTFAELCDSFITQAKNGDPYDIHNMPKEPFSAGFNLLIAIAIGFVVAFISTGVMKGKLTSVRQQVRADNYVTPDSLQLTHSRDLFLYSRVTKTERVQSSSSSSGRGGSSTHRSSSGRRHGGGGGKF